MNFGRLVPLAALALLLTGCAAFTEDTEPTAVQRGEDGTLEVYASFYPLQFLTEEIGGDRLTVSALTPPGVDPHNVELSPRTVTEMGAGSLVVYLSGFQAAVDDAVSATGARAFDAAEHTELRASGNDHAHGGDEGGDHDGENDHSDHDHGPLDPHFWLDPLRLAEVGEALAAELGDLDPDGAPTYAENLAELTDELTVLDEELQAGLAECEGDTIVVAHEAYAYLTAEHGLHQEGVAGMDPDSDPSPARLVEIGEVVERYDVDTIFVETLANPRIIEALAEDLGVQTAVLDPLENQQDESADYLDVMRANLTALQDALGCETA